MGGILAKKAKGKRPSSVTEKQSAFLSPNLRPDASKNRETRSPDVNADCNGNHLGTTKTSKREPPQLPIADKRVTVDKAQSMLAHASSKALSSLVTSSENGPNLKILSKFSFPFENAVFEGGGVKGITYVGAAKCLEDLGIKIKRFAGSSIGATIAGLLSVGFNSDELTALYTQDLSIFIRDSHCELLCFLPRIIRNLGMNPGKAFLDWYGRCLAVKTQDPDITFKQVYDRFGTELCVIVLNMNSGREEYFHPKTTPNLPIRIAIRMSISVPGVLEPIPLRHADGEADLYIDGGVICNYPIYVFDGWWLSMEPQNHVYKKISRKADKTSTANPLACLSDTRSRFAERNNKTLGFKQTTNNDFFNDTFIHSMISDELSLGNRDYVYSRPNTKLVKKRLKQLVSREKAAEAKSLQLEALLKFFEVLQGCSNADGYVIRDELAHSLTDKQGGFTSAHMSCLFGKDITVENLMKDMPVTAESSLIAPTDLYTHLSHFGLDVYRLLESSAVLRVSMSGGAKSFLSKLQRNITNAARRGFVKAEDFERTVNIHIDYIEYLDFEMCTKDKEFLIQQGYKHTLSFLQRYMEKHEGSTERTTLPHFIEETRQNPPMSKTSEEPIFFIDDDESYDDWLCNLEPDNV